MPCYGFEASFESRTTKDLDTKGRIHYPSRSRTQGMVGASLISINLLNVRDDQIVGIRDSQKIFPIPGKAGNNVLLRNIIPIPGKKGKGNGNENEERE